MSIDNFITHPTLEYQGQIFEYNDRVYIHGYTSKFFFRSHQINERTGAEWVNVFEDNYYQRSFHLDKIKIKKSVKKNGKMVVVDSVCVAHPKYTAQRKPRTDCARCWAAYEGRKKNDR